MDGRIGSFTPDSARPALPEITTILILATFLLVGLVKGVIGLGLPTISLALLVLVIALILLLTKLADQ